MNNDENLDLLDLDDGTNDSLPDVAPLVAPRPKKPWLLFGVGVAIIVLATYVIVRTVGNDSSSSMEIDLDSPAVVVDGDVAPLQPKVEPAPALVKEEQPAPQPVEKWHRWQSKLFLCVSLRIERKLHLIQIKQQVNQNRLQRKL